jgi:hypothetical protein
MEDARWDASGRSRPIIRVEFMVGTHGPFVERFEKETFSADTRDQQLNTFAREIRTEPIL